MQRFSSILREKNIFYIEREENSNKRIDIYEESIYTAPTKNLVNFEKDAPTKSRKEERMEEIYELEKDSEFWPHDKKYILSLIHISEPTRRS